MGIILTASRLEPSVLKLHALNPGQGFLHYNDYGTTTGKFIAYVKLEDERIGQIVVPTRIMTNKAFSDPLRFFNATKYNRSNCDEYLAANKHLAEQYLETYAARDSFKEMYFCKANYPNYPSKK